MRNLLRRLQPYAGVLKWLLALALLAWVFYDNIYRNRAAIGGVVGRGIDAWALSIAFVLCAGSVLLTFVRWYLLVWAQEFDFRLRDAFRLGFLGLLLNYVAPGQVGGDLFKAALIAKDQQSRRLVAVATVLIDRILGLLALFIVGATVSLLLPGVGENEVLATIAGFLWLGAVAGTIGLFVVLHPATPRAGWLNRLVKLKFVGRVIGELIQAVVLYQSKRKVVVLAVAMSIFGHLGMLSTFYFGARALQLGETAPDYRTHLLIVPAAEVGASFVPVPGGVGVLEGAMSYFYGAADSRRFADEPLDWRSPPPEWREALRAFSTNRTLWKRLSLENETEAGRRQAAKIAAEIASADEQTAIRFFQTGRVPLTAQAAEAMYRAGHRELARAGGVLATFLFRLINLMVAAVGFVCCLPGGKKRHAAQPAEELSKA